MAISSVRDLLAAIGELEPTTATLEGATDFINEYEQRRLDLFSRSTDNEDLLSAANGKITELTNSVDALTKEKGQLEADLVSQKAKNYDLLMQVQTGDPIPSGEQPIENKLDPNGAVYHIDSLFTPPADSPFNQTGMPQGE